MRRIGMKRVLSRYAFTAACLLASCGSPQNEGPRDSSHVQQAEIERVRGLLRQVKGGSQEAKSGIIKMGDSAVPGILASLDDDELGLQALNMAGEMAEQSSGLTGLSNATPVFVKLLSAEDWHLREASSFTIESLANKVPENRQLSAALPALVDNLNDNQIEVRRAAAWALRVVGDETAVRPLISLLADDQMKMNASEALISIGRPAVPGLIGCLSEQSLGRKCARVLGEMGSPVVPEVIEALAHEEPSVRELSAWVLGMIADPSAIPRLREVAESDPAQNVRQSAGIAIMAIPQGSP